MCKLFVCRLIPVLFLVILVVSMDDEGLQLLPLPSEEDLRFDLNHTSEVEAGTLFLHYRFFKLRFSSTPS